MPKENSVPVTSQVVRELVEKVGDHWLFCRDNTAAALIQSHIDQVVAPYREALATFVVLHDEATWPELEVVEAAKAILSASPIPGAKAEETAGAEDLKKALDQAIDRAVIGLKEQA